MSLKITGLHKRYDGVDASLPAALSDIGFEAPAGAFLTLLGPSGCGKSTLLNMISGLDRPSAGRIEIDGHTVYDGARQLFLEPARRNLSMVFQSYAIWPHMTVGENIEFPLKHGNQRKTLSTAEREKAVTHALNRVQLERFRHRPAPLLSGGQQQRISLARALAQRPSIMLLDEPLSNLDAALREEMQKEIRAIVAAERITTVYVTHDQKEALSMSDLIVVLKDGRIEQAGTPREIYYRPATRFVAQFMGSPNLVDAQVEAVLDGGDTLLARSPLGSVRVALPAASPLRTAAPGAPVCLVIKQEDLRLEPQAPAHGDNPFDARIVGTTFHGDRLELAVRCGEQSLSAYVNARLPIAGEHVRLHCAPHEIHAIAVGG